jgi:hypothetical protein
VCLDACLSRKLMDTRAAPHLDQHARGRSPAVRGMDVCTRVQHGTYAGMALKPRGPAERGGMMKMVTCLSEIRKRQGPSKFTLSIHGMRNFQNGCMYGWGDHVPPRLPQI